MNKKAKTTIKLGALVFVILTSSFYMMLPDKVRIDVENTKTKYSVYEDDSFILAATEYLNLYDGTTKMRAKSRDLSFSIGELSTTLIRTSIWKDNITTIQKYTFNPSIEDVEKIPILNELECINCVGKIVHYEIRGISYDGETKEINSPFSFGHNMEIEWQEGNYYSKVFQQAVSDKIIIKYRPTSDYEVYKVRLFDPELEDIKEVKPSSFSVIYENLSKQVPIYTKVCTPTINAKNVSHIEDCIYEVSYKTEYYDGKVIGVEVADKEILGFVNVQDKILSKWSVPIGDRNFEEFGRCRAYEIEKGVCIESAI